jgi:hypothetical protein
MTPQERKKLDTIAWQLMDAAGQLGLLMDDLRLECDRSATGSIITDLHWAAENCTVIGLHQIGQARQDTMGFPEGG